MASGVRVADCVKDRFNEMKVNKCGDDQCKRIRLMTLKIDCGEITLDKIVREENLVDEDCYDVFVRELDDSKCHYILYDCHYDTTDGHKEDMLFEMWCGGCAPIKEKMKFASSKDALKKVLAGGCKFNVEKCDRDDFCIESFIKDILGQDVVRLERRDLCQQRMQHMQRKSHC